MSYDQVKAAMKHFQRTYGKPEGVVDDLFAAAADRLWALTSKMEGTFEFEVLSLREYFAARYLYRYAGEGTHGFDRTEVFRELLRRPYWLNTARFYGGNATGSDIYALEAGIRHELAENTSKHVRVAVWTLVTNGVLTADRSKQPQLSTYSPTTPASNSSSPRMTAGRSARFPDQATRTLPGTASQRPSATASTTRRTTPGCGLCESCSASRANSTPGGQSASGKRSAPPPRLHGSKSALAARLRPDETSVCLAWPQRVACMPSSF